jgi:hypothetical protein
MQDRYVGNVGDFGKLALLRCLMPGRRLAVCWYLTGSENDGKPGKGFDYLDRPDEFRHLAPEIYDALRNIVAGACAGARGVTALESSGLLADALFHRTQVPHASALRRSWGE